MSKPLRKNINLHRLVWHPDDFCGNQLNTSAFRKEDLKGGRSYISVSRLDMIDTAVERKIAAKQARRANGTSIKRELAHSTQLNCSEVSSQRDDAGCIMFEVLSKMTKENPAHCGIQNISGKTSNGYINQLRVALVKISTPPIPLEDFLQSV